MQLKAAIETAFSKLISQRGLVAFLSCVFVISLLIGFIGQYGRPAPKDSAADQAKNTQIERFFGPYRDGVRAGHLPAVAICAGMVFGFNLLGCVFITLGSIFIVPALTSVWAVAIGRGAASLHGTTPFSVPGDLAVSGLEWITYVLAASAGANIGLAFAFPKLKAGCVSRREAARQALREAGKLYIAIGIILVAQAIAEIFYVREVLLHGGTGVPLEPY